MNYNDGKVHLEIYDSNEDRSLLAKDFSDVDHLLIRTSGQTDVDFYSIHLEDTLWKDTDLTFKNLYMDMGYLNVRNAVGGMNFKDKYPLNLRADVNLPSLHDSLNIHDISVVAKGSLDTIQVGFATETPDMLTGWGVIHPVRDNVPMKGALKPAQMPEAADSI